MATNTAPQWLKNTGVFDHSTLYLLCVIASCILIHYKSVSNTMQVYKHELSHLHSYICTACAVRVALCHVTLINSGPSLGGDVRTTHIYKVITKIKGCRDGSAKTHRN